MHWGLNFGDSKLKASLLFESLGELRDLALTGKSAAFASARTLDDWALESAATLGPSLSPSSRPLRPAGSCDLSIGPPRHPARHSSPSLHSMHTPDERGGRVLLCGFASRVFEFD